MNFFDKANNLINDVEGSAVNFLTAAAPWLAPLAPAYMTYQHMVDFLMFPAWLALALAGLVEILGFGTVSTFLDFWFYNRREKAGSKKAPLQVVIASFVFYLLLIIVSNVVIDITKAYMDVNWQKGALIMVRALLTLQTIPGAMIVAVRTGHRDLLREIKEEKAKKDNRKLSETFRNTDDIPSEKPSSLPKDWRNLRPTLSVDDIKKLSVLTPDEVKALANRHGVDPRTVQNWRTSAQDEIANNPEIYTV